TLAQVQHSAGEQFVLPKKLRDFPKLPKTKTTKHVVFSEAPMDHHSMSDMPRSELENMFFVNGRVYHPERMDLVSYVGEWEHWQLVNNSHMDHHFHLYGTQFLVTHRERSGENTAEPVKAWRRSEEHTSELQSRFDLVCRLLLEKKKGLQQRQMYEK